MRQRAAAAAAREGAGGAAAGAAEREAAARGGGAGGGFLAAVREEISLWQADYAAARDRLAGLSGDPGALKRDAAPSQGLVFDEDDDQLCGGWWQLCTLVLAFAVMVLVGAYVAGLALGPGSGDPLLSAPVMCQWADNSYWAGSVSTLDGGELLTLTWKASQGVWQWANVDLPPQPDDEMLPTGAVSLGTVARASGRCDAYLEAREAEMAAAAADGADSKPSADARWHSYYQI